MHKKSRVGFLARARRVVALVFYASLILAICFHSTVAAADYMTEDEKIDFYSSINNMFYDGEAKKSACTRPGSCKVYGDTDDERLWSALRNVGFTPEETAAIMGNTKHEGGTPARQEGVYNSARNNNCLTQEGNAYTIWTYDNEHHAKCMYDLSKYYDNGVEKHAYQEGHKVVGIGIGMVQWSSKGRREGYLGKMRELGLLDKYFEGDAYKTWGSYGTLTKLKEEIIKDTGSDGDFWALFCAAISFIYHELKEGDYTHVLDGSGVENMAGRVAAKYEICGECAEGKSSNIARRQTALEIWDRYQNGEFDAVEAQLTGATLAYARSRQNGTLIAAGGSQTDAGSNVSGVYNANKVNGSSILIIGDQTVVKSSTALMAKMPGVSIQASNDKVFNNASGNTRGQIPTNVVISLGVNDSAITEEQARAVADSFGSKNIYFVLNYSDTEPDKYAANNATLTGVATVYANVKVIDWPNAVISTKAKDSSKTYFEEDGVSPASPDGAYLFADTIYKTFVGFDNAGVCGVGSGERYDPGDPLSFAKQFIIDSNYAYDKRFTVPMSYEVGQIMNTPGGYESVTLNSSHAQVLKGLFNGAGPTGSTTRCWDASSCGQCTALSQWFVSMISEYSVEGGCGKDVVNNLVNRYPEIQKLTEPEPMTIFSQIHRNDDGSIDTGHCGHTGLIMDVYPDGTMLILDNNNSSGNLKVTKHRTVEQYRYKNTVYAKIPLEKLHFEHLGQTYE